MARQAPRARIISQRKASKSRAFGAVVFWLLAFSTQRLSAGTLTILLESKSPFVRDGAFFLLSAVYTERLPEVKENVLELDIKYLPQAFLDQVAKSPEPVPAATVYSAFKKFGFEYRTRSASLWHKSIPETLDAFTKETNFKEWKKSVKKVSRVKELTRILYSSAKISVAQTHNSTTGDESTEVRETEVIIKRENAEDWDFYVYDRKGNLANESTFGKSEIAPSPVSCMACHYRAETHLFQQVPTKRF